MAEQTLLRIRDLHVYYGASHTLQGVNLTLKNGVHAVVGRNGMGKTTLCNTVMGLLSPQRGSIRFNGSELVRQAPYRIAALGIGYTPQGRRLWPSLTVDEHLRLGAKKNSRWTAERIYDTFPRLAERRYNGAARLSGGEQQMLAISRALLQDPRLLVLDEPTEGLAPVIVSQVESMLSNLAGEDEVGILLVEQNIGVATAIAHDVAIMVNGAITTVIPAVTLAPDRQLQQRLLGVGRYAGDSELQEIIPTPAGDPAAGDPAAGDPAAGAPAPGPDQPMPANPDDATSDSAHEPQAGAVATAYIPPTRWSAARWQARTDKGLESLPSGQAPDAFLYRVPAGSGPQTLAKEVLIVGTFDTKRAELRFIRDRLLSHKLAVRTVDLSTSQTTSSADIPPHQIAAYHQRGASAVFTGDRGTSVRAMSLAFRRWLSRQPSPGGIISAAGSGGTALVTPAMQQLAIGIPKVMISTVASGNVGQYVGSSDIMMMYSVTDVQGINRISRRILANGADALAGMVTAASRRSDGDDKPALGMTMFGVTTTAVQQLSARLEERFDCLVFHATGVGGRSMEKLADNGLLHAAIDLTTTEVCDLMMGGVFAADEDRFGAFIRTRIPYIGSVGALDMVNFGPPETIPERYRQRTFVEHNPQVTLMRTTAAENTRMGRWIAERLNQMTGPVRFLLPEAGVSSLDAPGQAFYDPAADRALFDAITATFRETPGRRLIRTSFHINDPQFADAVIAAFDEIVT